jgi:hypothetical protein
MTEVKFHESALDYEFSDYIPPYVQEGFWPRMEMAAVFAREARHPELPVVDLGCNGGHLLELIGPPCWGYDVAKYPLSVARAAGHDARRADITKDEIELAPVVTICEVLEHLADPHSVVRRLNCDPVEFVVASGPYQETPEAHYEQHCWAWDEEGFAAMFEAAGFRIVKQTTTGIFQALLATRK